jgi:hypothetical protein
MTLLLAAVALLAVVWALPRLIASLRDGMRARGEDGPWAGATRWDVIRFVLLSVGGAVALLALIAVADDAVPGLGRGVVAGVLVVAVLTFRARA